MRQADDVHRRRRPRRPAAPRGRPRRHRPTRRLSSSVTTRRNVAGEVDQIGGSTGSTHRGSTTVTPMPWSPRRSATSRAQAAMAPTATTSTSGAPVRCSTSTRSRPCRPPATGVRQRPLGKAHAAWARRRRRPPRAKSSRSWSPSRGAAIRSPGTVAKIDRSHMPLWDGAVVAGDAGSVEDEGDRGAVQRDVEQHLVVRPVEEGGVHRHHRVQARERQTGRGRRPRAARRCRRRTPGPGTPRRRRPRPDRLQHRRGDGDDVGTLTPDLDHLVGEDAGPRRSGRPPTRARSPGR